MVLQTLKCIILDAPGPHSAATYFNIPRSDRMCTLRKKNYLG